MVVKKDKAPEVPPDKVFIREIEVTAPGKRDCHDAYLSITNPDERYAVYEFKGWARGQFSVVMEP